MWVLWSTALSIAAKSKLVMLFTWDPMQMGIGTQQLSRAYKESGECFEPECLPDAEGCAEQT